MPCMTHVISFYYGKSHINGPKKLGTMMLCMTYVISFYFGITHHLALSCVILHCLASSCIVLHHLALSCIILHCLASSCIVLQNLASSCIVLHCLASSCIVLHHLASSCMVLHHLAWPCIVLHCLASSCIVLHHLASSFTNPITTKICTPAPPMEATRLSSTRCAALLQWASSCWIVSPHHPQQPGREAHPLISPTKHDGAIPHHVKQLLHEVLQIWQPVQLPDHPPTASNTVPPQKKTPILQHRTMWRTFNLDQKNKLC